ncbi:hypothetical protein [Wolbachia endosymbiont (group A) of Clivina fossor]
MFNLNKRLEKLKENSFRKIDERGDTVLLVNKKIIKISQVAS